MYSGIKLKIIFLLILIILLSGFIFFSNKYFKERYYNDQYLSETKISDIKRSHLEYKRDIDLYYNGQIIPYASLDEFYLFYTDTIDEYKKIYSKDGFHIQFVSKIDNYIINLILYNEDYYKEVTLQLTNIPVIYIDNETVSNLYGFGSDIYQYKSEYSIRGNSSRNSPKKSYKLHLKNNKGGSLSIPLLGMNESDTWILNPIYFDNSYIREKLGYDIWNNLSDKFNHTLEYVEFIMDGEYQGLYYLEEEVTIDTFEGNPSTDLLISIQEKTSKDEEEFKLVLSKLSNNQVNEFEIEEGLKGQYNLQLDIIESLNNLMNNKYTIVKLKYDLSNNALYSVFLNAALAIDNIYKNQKILFRNENDVYIIQKTPWDLDWAFQNENIQLLYPQIVNKVSNIIVDQCLPVSIRENEIFKWLEKLYYTRFRKEFYYEENIYNLIDKYVDYITKYGAVERDKNKWGKTNFERSVNIIKLSISQKIKYLDKYYGGSKWILEMNQNI